MSVELVVPSLGESVKSAIVARWHKKVGDLVAVDEPIVTLDSDKATLEIPSPAAGRIEAILAEEGQELPIGAVLARIEEPSSDAVHASTAPAPIAPPAPSPEPRSGPAVRAAMAEAGLNQTDVQPSGASGRITRGDVEKAVAAKTTPAPVAPKSPPAPPSPSAPAADEEVIPMTTLRRRIAQRLVEAQSTAAILTTFNEVDMSAVMALRERYQDRFVKKYGVKMGFMSFFVKATIEALKAFPSANAEVRGTDIVYKHYFHIGVAVSGPRGLVVPVIRDADRLSFAGTEKAIAAFGERAKANQIGVDDLTGGSFTISNGGTFGSMMSTPILNPPQVAILGMHAIQKRAVVVDDQIVIRPMMYLAVSYDHRLLDGREAVGFLVRIKECVEDPERMLIEV
ncbi:dihydrolipoyllysine-residue succinyltransferase component of 2-oxoglutarate dehydrogenase complex [Deltaproteobacteria bacterium]|nr:dihydrolipoyllysine-residue succinyltransferase component of 2-oxoglutarate dehydrogenase complex [Deltaproteobacteria bacterium]